MKKLHLIPTVLIAIQLALVAASPAFGQQKPVSTYQLIYSDFMNPGMVRPGNVNGVLLSTQQRTGYGTGWRSTSQFLNFYGTPKGRKGTFRLGILASHDLVHTEHRFEISPTISAKVYERNCTALRVGIGVGILSWSSNYTGSYQFETGDPILDNSPNIIEINPSAGLSLVHQSEKGLYQLGISGQQLSGNFIASPLEGIRIHPNVFAEGMALFPVAEGILAGPRGVWRESMGNELNQGGGNSDLGMMVRMPERQIWGAAMVRVPFRNIAIGAGFPLMLPEAEKDENNAYKALSVNFGIQYPIDMREAVGPTVDLGISYLFGKPRKEFSTLPLACPIWKTEGTLVAHRQSHLDSLAPLELTCKPEVFRKKIYLTYEFPDQVLAYCGAVPYLRNGLVSHVGKEWEGIDFLTYGLVSSVVQECLHPDSSNVQDPENMEAMKRLDYVQVSCHIRDDATNALFGSGVAYEGEFGTNTEDKDALAIPIIFDDKDTLIVARIGKTLRNLDLAALKLFAMRDRLQFELRERYGDQYRIIREENRNQSDAFEDDLEDTRPIIYLRTPRITTNNPNLQAFQQNRIEMKFSRHPGNYPPDDTDDNWIPREENESEWEEWEMSQNDYDD